MMRAIGDCILLLAIIVLTDAKTDQTKQKNACSALVVDALISRFSNKCIFKQDYLLSKVAARISGCKQDIGGIWQVNKALFETTKTDTSSRMSKLRTKVEKWIGKKWVDVEYGDLDIPEIGYLAFRMIMELSVDAIPLDTSSQVSYLTNTLQSTGFVAATIDSEKQSLMYNCKSRQADMVFVLDGSGSVGESSFKKTLKFLKDIVDSVTVGEKATRIGMIRYSNDATTIFNLIGTSKNDVKDRIDRVAYRGGSTYTNKALDKALKMMKDYAGESKAKKRMIILLTDGVSTDKPATVESARKIHDENIRLIAVGIGSGANEEELNNVGTKPSCKNVHLLKDFDVTEAFVTTLRLDTCKAAAKVIPGELITGVLDTGEMMELEFDVKSTDVESDGTFRLELTADVGYVSASVSLNDPGPNTAMNDLQLEATADGGTVQHLPMNDQGYARRRRRSTGTSLGTVYIGLTGNGQQNSYSLSTSAAVPAVKPSWIAMILCLLILITRI